MRKQRYLEEILQRPPLSMQQILDAREQRVQRQNRMMKLQEGTLVSFTLNIAGAVKAAPLFSRAFAEGKRRILSQLQYSGILVLLQEESNGETGEELYLLTNGQPMQIKRLMCQIEDGFPMGRLFDIDVMARGVPKVSRSDLHVSPRKCLICDQMAAACARSQQHSIRQLLEKTVELICDYFEESDAEEIAQAACRALLYEVSVTPKPGLVDRQNNGSHRDMDLFCFVDSACVLYPYFRACTKMGMKEELSPQQLFESLRPLGKDAEERMYRMTGGVNTHKGAIFSMGIFCAAAGRLAEQPFSVEKMGELCKQMCAHLLEDFAGIAGKQELSYGEKLYLRYGVTGIRGEAAQGFPSVLSCGYPMLLNALQAGKSLNDAGVQVLLALIVRVQDTNILARSDPDTLRWAQQSVRKVLEEGVDLEQVRALDQAFIQRRISPGGCADLLALCFFLHFLQLHNE